MPVGAGNPVTLCDLGILADQAAEPISPKNPDICARSRWMRAPGGRALLQRPMRVLCQNSLMGADLVFRTR
jgi:hypothetical protein